MTINEHPEGLNGYCGLGLGEHWNPYNSPTHGWPNWQNFHAGDLGEYKQWYTDTFSVINKFSTVVEPTLFGTDSIIGKTIVFYNTRDMGQ